MFTCARIRVGTSSWKAPKSINKNSLTSKNVKLIEQKMFLHLHEYQSQELLSKYGVNVSKGGVASTPEEAQKIAESLGGQDYVIKAQVLAGGRGLGTFTNGFKGGVHLCNTVEEVYDISSKMLNQRLITKQTGSEGKLVNKLFIAQRYFIRRESYLAILLDRKQSGAMIVSSRKGGVNIEKVAEEDPSAISQFPVKLQSGLSDETAENVVKSLGFPAKLTAECATQVQNLYKFFVSTDATQVEINPFVETSTGEILCVDAKINFDDNAAFRQKEIFAMRDFSQEDEREVAAAKYDLNFIGLDGSIGCLVNGAGLAMATLDIIKLYGGSPANFLDIGGGANAKQVTEALRIISSDPKVKAILINIFGGIMRCDVIALGVINAAQTLNLNIPLVVRLEGTNVEEAKKIMEDSPIRVIPAVGLSDAARKVVRIVDIVEMAKMADLNVNFELPL